MNKPIAALLLILALITACDTTDTGLGPDISGEFVAEGIILDDPSYPMSYRNELTLAQSGASLSGVLVNTLIMGDETFVDTMQFVGVYDFPDIVLFENPNDPEARAYVGFVSNQGQTITLSYGVENRVFTRVGS